MKYTRRSDVVDVTIWNTHGDHPIVKKLDECVNNFVDFRCDHCTMSNRYHGVILTIYGSHLIVCPGDRIIKTAKGNYVSYHRKEFKRLYRKVKPAIVFETESKKDIYEAIYDTSNIVNVTYTDPKREGEGKEKPHPRYLKIFEKYARSFSYFEGNKRFTIAEKDIDKIAEEILAECLKAELNKI